MKLNFLKSACDVLQTICKDGGPYADCICRGETQFANEKDTLNFENFDQLLPKFHLCGINFLLEMDLLADCDKNLKKVMNAAKNLEFPCE